MKTSLNIFFLIYMSISLAQQDQTRWKSDFDFGDGFSISTFLKFEDKDGQFLITSPKNADVRLYGGFKAKLGRLFGKSPKKGIILTIKGRQNNDSLLGNANIPIFGNLEFKGIISKDLLSGSLIKNDTLTVGTLLGIKTEETRIHYNNLYPKILKLTQDNIYSKNIFLTKEWKKFQKKLKNLCTNAQDDIELFLGFNMLSPKLPFSHYNLFIQKEETDTKKIDDNKPSIIFEEKNENTAYLEIKNFSTSQNELAEVLPSIVKNRKYKNLIVDLRDNGGGGIGAASEFAKFVLSNSTKVGYFITNKLYYSEFDHELFETLPEVKPETTSEFINGLKENKGAKLLFDKTENQIFSGNLYVLINKKTASTCEPIVYMLKKNKRSTVIGEKTAGAMLSAAYFDILDKYKLILPIADFYTYDGKRLDRVGVMPDIEIASEQALDEALRLIKSTD